MRNWPCEGQSACFDLRTSRSLSVPLWFACGGLEGRAEAQINTKTSLSVPRSLAAGVMMDFGVT